MPAAATRAASVQNGTPTAPLTPAAALTACTSLPERELGLAVGTVAHVVACLEAGANGVVVGRALLSGAISLPETLAAIAVRSS